MKAFPKHLNQLICLVYVVKPLLLLLIMSFYGYLDKSNRGFYAHKRFTLRLYFDIGLVPLGLYTAMVTYHVDGLIFVYVWTPLLIANSIIYFFEVKPARSSYDKVTFRSLDIQTIEENNQLWSTATEDDEDHQETKPETKEFEEDDDYH